MVTPKERATKSFALMIKTATGIKTFIEEESYGA